MTKALNWKINRVLWVFFLSFSVAKGGTNRPDKGMRATARIIYRGRQKFVFSCTLCIRFWPPYLDYFSVSSADFLYSGFSTSRIPNLFFNFNLRGTPNLFVIKFQVYTNFWRTLYFKGWHIWKLTEVVLEIFNLYQKFLFFSKVIYSTIDIFWGF
jgi:hypothetical protein